jgi:hypothetical protein
MDAESDRNDGKKWSYALQNCTLRPSPIGDNNGSVGRSDRRIEVTMATGLVFPSAVRFANGGESYSAAECRQDLRLTAAEIWFDGASCHADADAVGVIFERSIRPSILRGSAPDRE